MRIIIGSLLIASLSAVAQPLTGVPVSGLVFEERVPDDLLARKSIVLHDPAIPYSDLETVQQGFRQCGIDAVLYFPIDIPASNDEVNREFVRNLVARNIKFIVLLTHPKENWDFVITAFNGKPSWFTPGQTAWHLVGSSLPLILQSMNRVAMSSQKKRNLLVNPVPELDLNLNPVTGNQIGRAHV